MYQVTIGVDKENFRWISLIDKKIRPLVENNGVIFIEENAKRVCLGIGVYSDNKFSETLSKVLRDFILKDLKEEYLYSSIKRYAQNDYLVRVYTKILNLFNNDEEKRILDERFHLYSNFSLDGFVRFRLSPLKDKWNDLVGLSYNNIDLIQDDKSFAILIQHLVSCLPSVVESVSIDFDEGYKIALEGVGEILVEKEEGVIFSLIEYMPNKIFLTKKALSNSLADRITSVFGVNFVQII